MRGGRGRDLLRYAGFSLIEVIVVIAIIAILIGLLLPTLQGARAASKSIACQSNMRQIGVAMAAYAAENAGWLFPPDDGNFTTLAPVYHRWPQIVMHTKPPPDPTSTDPRDWTPKIVLCPADDADPNEAHSYVVNGHLVEKKVRYFSKNFGGPVTNSDVVVMGEKITTENDYYVETSAAGTSDYKGVVEPHRHGIRLKSNFLHLDLHVDNREPQQIAECKDPWDVLPTVAPVISE
jgi:prepilin-type N-terminal cleavage/methylation domain-containing protein